MLNFLSFRSHSIYLLAIHQVVILLCDNLWPLSIIIYLNVSLNPIFGAWFPPFAAWHSPFIKAKPFAYNRMLPIRSTKLSIQPKDLDLALTYRAQIVQSEEGKGGEEEERRGREEERESWSQPSTQVVNGWFSKNTYSDTWNRHVDQKQTRSTLGIKLPTQNREKRNDE